MEVAKVFVKGFLKDPFVVDIETGRDLKSAKLDSTKQKQMVDIGVWAGAIEDIKYITFPTSEEYGDKDEPRFSDEELNKFANEKLYKYIFTRNTNEYETWVELYRSKLLDFATPLSKQFISPYTQRMIEAIRRKYDTFAQSFPEWLAEQKEQKGALERQEDFEKTMEQKYLKVREAYNLQQMVEQIDAVQEEAEKIVDQRLVGTLTKKAEFKFLADEGAISLDSEGNLKAVLKVNGIVPYRELSAKIGQWRDREDRKRYRDDVEAISYEEQLGDLASSMSMNA